MGILEYDLKKAALEAEIKVLEKAIEEDGVYSPLYVSEMLLQKRRTLEYLLVDNIPF